MRVLLKGLGQKVKMFPLPWSGWGASSLRPAIKVATDEGGGQADTGLPSGSHSPGPSYHLGSQRYLLTGA